VDATLRAVSRLAALDVDSYLECDARFSWHGIPATEIGIVGTNLARPHHEEYSSGQGLVASDVERGVYAYCSVRF
jgi:hypothetical protein